MRSLWIVVALSLIAVTGCSSGPAHPAAAGSAGGPVDAVNRYVAAADRGDVAAVAAATCQAHRAEIASASVRQLVLGNDSGTPRRDHGYTLTIGAPTLAGDAADVPVDIAYQDNNEIKNDHATFHVVREGDVWLVCEIHGFGAS